MTQELIAIIVGIIVSWALEIVPGLKKVWSEWEYKPLTLFIIFTAVPVAAWALTCFAGFNFYNDPVCALQGGVSAFMIGFIAFMGSQTNYTVAARHTENAQTRNNNA